ncbi:MAG: helix-turn-helix domain-containing protein [Planctomycetota bacterium]
MALTEIRVYDYIGNKKVIVIPLKDMKTVRMVCRQMHPRYEEEKYTLYYDEEPLSWDSTFEYLEKKYNLTVTKVLTFKFRYCSFQEAMKRLQREDFQLKELITSGELKAYSKSGQMIFKEADLDRLINDQMDEPTLILTPDKLHDLQIEQDANLEENLDENGTLDEEVSLQLGPENESSSRVSSSETSLPIISFGSLENAASEEDKKETKVETVHHLNPMTSLFEDEEAAERRTLPPMKESAYQPHLLDGDETINDNDLDEVESGEKEVDDTSETFSEIASDWSHMETINEPGDLILKKEVSTDRQETISVPPPSAPMPTNLAGSPASQPATQPLFSGKGLLGINLSESGTGLLSNLSSVSTAQIEPRMNLAAPQGKATPLSRELLEETPNPDTSTEFKRHTRITYYNQMNPFRHYLLQVELNEKQLALKNKETISQVSGEMQVPKESPKIEIIPTFPGCLIVPERIVLDVESKNTRTEFWITPLTEGFLEKAHVDFYHQGRQIASVSTPTNIAKTTLAKATLVAGFSAPLLSTIFSAFDITFNDNLPILFRFITTFVGSQGWISLSNFGLLLFLVAVVGGFFWYKICQPRLAPVVESEI